MIIPWPVRAAQLYKIRQIDTSHWISFDPNFCRGLDVSTKEIQWTYQYKVLEHLKDLIIGKANSSYISLTTADKTQSPMPRESPWVARP